MPRWPFGLGASEDNREFNVVIYEEDYKELCAWVLRKPHIETGGDLFGLWANKYSAVIQLVLGPGQRCRRTSTSFYQDVNYLEKVGMHLTQKEGICHIGEWHSHHQLGLARPSGGDENTVWNNMPTYNLTRFVIFIANINHSGQYYSVNVGCFLFEIDGNGKQLPVLPGKFQILNQESPFSGKLEVKKFKRAGEEEKKGDEFKVDIQDLTLTEERNSLSVSIKLKKRTYGQRSETSRWLAFGASEDIREFNVVIYQNDYKELCAWVLRKPHIETGGDLFGLWANKYSAVIQLVLGPGKGCRRTPSSFYQDVTYLEKVGMHLTQKEGICHIGEWHSHHQLGLARPSGGDENTVWNNMPTYNLTRFVIFIANINHSGQYYSVNVGCFLFEIDGNGKQLPVLPGKFQILNQESPFSGKLEVKKFKRAGEEEKKREDFNFKIQDLILTEGKISIPVPIKPEKRAHGRENEHAQNSQNSQPQPKKTKPEDPKTKEVEGMNQQPRPEEGKQPQEQHQLDKQGDSKTSHKEDRENNQGGANETNDQEKAKTGNGEDKGIKTKGSVIQEGNMEEEEIFEASGVQEDANLVQHVQSQQRQGHSLAPPAIQGQPDENDDRQKEKECSKIIGKEGAAQNSGMEEGGGGAQKLERTLINKESSDPHSNEPQGSLGTKKHPHNDKGRKVEDLDSCKTQSSERVKTENDPGIEHNSHLAEKKSSASLDNKGKQTQEKSKKSTGQMESLNTKGGPTLGQGKKGKSKQTQTDPNPNKTREAKGKSKQGATLAAAPSTKGSKQDRQGNKNPPKRYTSSVEIALKAPGGAKKAK